MSELELAWAAGFIDGEGSIHIAENGRGHFQLSLSVTQSKRREALDRLKDILGGSVSQTSNKWGRVYRWAVMTQQARRSLELLLPYLTLKQVEAEVAIAYQSRKCRGCPFDPAADSRAAIELKRLKRSHYELSEHTPRLEGSEARIHPETGRV